MQDPQLQCLVKRNYQPAFTSETMPRLLYVSRRPPVQEARPRLLHAHPDFVEVLLIDEGSARFLIGDNAYEVRAGDLLVFNSGVVHDELSDSPFGSWCIAVGGLRLPGLLENALIPENAAPVHPMGAELPDLRALYNIMFRYLTTDRPDCEAFCHRLMLALLDRALTITGSTTLRLPASPEPGTLARQVRNISAITSGSL